MVDQGNKQVRVDNWGTFFLQRLQVFFAKTDYCDLTLQFEGNVQLKVHRLVMNACTEYFRFLEETCPPGEENSIIMPHDLQSDVIVPIVNFMYTGMLEFHVSLYEKLYKAAELMNINILTKLLEAQTISQKSSRLKPDPPPIKKPPQMKSPNFFELPSSSSSSSSRKVWKRKTIHSSGSPLPTTHPSSQLQFDQKWSSTISDPLTDNTPKPTRFEWPDDELPTLSLLDTNFEDISYNSKPLLTKEEEEKIKPSFDDLRNNVELPKKIITKSTNNAVNLKEMEEFAKEQKIRNAMFEEVGEYNDTAQKRKVEPNSPIKFATKKIKTNNKENKETTISVESVSSTDIDHTKIVTEILKKYPDLVKKNKNIKLKIMPGNKEISDKKLTAVVDPAKSQPQTEMKVQKQVKKSKFKHMEDEDEGPWLCKKCINVGGDIHEFVLYYLYRKHMTDVHDEVFDPQMCKYCGRRCNTPNLMMYHMFTKHALKPPPSYNFPKCNKCAYIALSPTKLLKHKEHHDEDEMQCHDCQLSFITAQYLATHVRMTGHYSKPGKICYDCQYCMKKLQSGIALFTHVRKSHLIEAKRDGINCLEELESLEDLEDDEDEENGGYIIPEMLNENVMQKDKVKIISNVKVQNTQSQLVPMETSSEAEALNNVASGIATSLGLVDIVVLDENQQYILQQDGQNEQTEFIIPELAHGQPFTGQVITTQDDSVIQQGMIQNSTGDITSTDELVMVLTDHDYPDGQVGENPDNSNIVVLYSHPVDGQEGQFITSQGNLLVNSQTGMLELRNGSTISTTTASQMIVTNSIDTPIESIEMIQREIDNHTELKQEPYYEEERKRNIHQETTKPTSNNALCISLPENETLPLTDKPTTNEEPTTVETEAHSRESIEETQQQQVCDEKSTTGDDVDGTLEADTEDSMEIGETEHEMEEAEYIEESAVQEEMSIPENVEISDPLELIEESNQENEEHDSEFAEDIATNEEGVDVPPEKPHSDDNHEEIFNDPSEMTSVSDEPPKSDDEKEQPEQEEEPQNQGEPMEVDGKISELENEHQIEDSERQVTDVAVHDTIDENPTEEHFQTPEENVIDLQETTSVVPPEESENVENEMQVSEEEAPVAVEAVQQISEDNEIVLQQPNIDDGIKNKIVIPSPKRKTPSDINKTILDDWEDDTDSQQSDKNAESSESQDVHVQVSNEETVPSAVENVNKLMDDWEEEDEEDKKD